MNSKIFAFSSFFFGFVFVTASAASPLHSSSNVLIVANSNNPTNDPDVQRGIDQRLEQERQARIEACVRNAEANLTAAQRAVQEEEIRRHCTSREPKVTSKRG